MIRVTFDSNVWRIVASPSKFPKETSLYAFQKINDAVRAKEVLPCLAETVFTVEAVKRSDRKAFLASYRPRIESSSEELPNGTISISFSISPDLTHHPGNNPHLSSHLQDALALGFKLLHCPRIGYIRNPDILDHHFLADDYVPMGRRQDIFGRCLMQISAISSGIAHLERIGENYAASGQSWHNGIENAPSSEDGNIAKAVAEWADGDAVAAHIAYENDYFCTRDNAKGAGPDSILATRQREWLRSRYNVQFVTPEELANRL